MLLLVPILISIYDDDKNIYVTVQDFGKIYRSIIDFNKTKVESVQLEKTLDFILRLLFVQNFIASCHDL